MTKFLLAFIVTTNITMIAMLTLLTSYIVDHIVWDIDKVRNTHVTEVSYWYAQGCERGTQYPPEFRMPVQSFNVNSVPSWCHDQGQPFEEDFQRSAWKLGR